MQRGSLPARNRRHAGGVGGALVWMEAAVRRQPSRASLTARAAAAITSRHPSSTMPVAFGVGAGESAKSWRACACH
jgi:hypothetical protein